MESPIRRAWEVSAQLGEGPVYDSRQDCVLFVDIKGQQLFRLRLETGDLDHWDTPDLMCWVIPRHAAPGYVAGLGRRIGFLQLDPFRFEPFHEIAPPDSRVRLNDAKVDADGWLWAGTMDDAEQETDGVLLSISPERKVVVADAGYAVPNGPTFSPDGRILYHTDTARRVVYRFRRTPDGGLADKTPLIRFPDAWGYPDGMATDADGGVWIGHWDGARISRFFPDGTLDRHLAMPAARITSCCFAGRNLDRLFVTSAMGGAAGHASPGALFEVDCGQTGTAAHAWGG